VSADGAILEYPGLGAPLILAKRDVEAVGFGDAPAGLPVLPILGRGADRANLWISFARALATAAPSRSIRLGPNNLWYGGDSVDGFACRVDDEDRARSAFASWPVREA